MRDNALFYSDQESVPISRSQFVFENKPIKMEGDNEIEIGRIKSPSEFYFVFKKWRSRFEMDLERMQSYLEQRPPKPRNPRTLKAGQRVLIRDFCQRNIWMRAQICQCHQQGCKVLFLDTGEVEGDIGFDEIHQLPEDYSYYPPQCAKKLLIEGTV